MSSRPTSKSFVKAIKSDGTELVPSNVLDKGSYTLLANTLYYFPLGSDDAIILSATMRWDAAIVITSITWEDTDFPPEMVSDFMASTDGQWIDEDPATAFVPTKGAGVTVTNGVVAVAGGAKGGCRFNVSDQGARRSRLAVQVGVTGGGVIVSSWAKG